MSNEMTSGAKKGDDVTITSRYTMEIVIIVVQERESVRNLSDSN